MSWICWEKPAYTLHALLNALIMLGHKRMSYVQLSCSVAVSCGTVLSFQMEDDMIDTKQGQRDYFHYA